MKQQLTLTFLSMFFTSVAYTQGTKSDSFDRVYDGMTLLMPTPIFKDGGDKGLANFLANNLKYPNGQHLAGNVYVEFIVDGLGNVRNEKVVNGITKEADAEALRVVRLLKFIPVKVMDKPVAVKHHLFIDFSLVGKK